MERGSTAYVWYLSRNRSSSFAVQTAEEGEEEEDETVLEKPMLVEDAGQTRVAEAILFETKNGLLIN